jgi:uncharacterized membrane protein YoaK (UPF0700 family)
MAWFWWLIGVIVVAAWIVAIVDIVRRRHTRTIAATSAWILLVIILPVLGTLGYFLVNGGFGGTPGVEDPNATRLGR